MTEPVVVEVHTSDRTTFKRCRRKYSWASTLRRNLIRTGPDKLNFWLGTGFHFALEDFHGYRRFEHPALAFAAYYDAQKHEDLPDEADEGLDLAVGMLSYYAEEWLEEHPEPYKTLWIDGVPQVEVEVAVDLTDLLFERARFVNGDENWLDEVLHAYNDERGGPPNGRAEVHYVVTYDRVVIVKREGVIRPLDYKTAASFDTLNLQTNPQAGAYDWVADLFYSPLGYKADGIVWQQHKKSVPREPKVLKKPAGELSQDMSQATTYRLYRRALRRQFGEIPERYTKMLDHLIEQQDVDGDAFVRRQILRRNEAQREVEQEKIIAEALEMLDPTLFMYPNPTKDCSWDCPFKDPCLAMDDGSDFEYLLKADFAEWSGYKDDWRERVKYPEDQVSMATS